MQPITFLECRIQRMDPSFATRLVGPARQARGNLAPADLEAGFGLISMMVADKSRVTHRR